MDALLVRIILLLITTMSPELRAALVKFFTELEADAKKTGNPWDDILVAILKTLLLNE